MLPNEINPLLINWLKKNKDNVPIKCNLLLRFKNCTMSCYLSFGIEYDNQVNFFSKNIIPLYHPSKSIQLSSFKRSFLSISFKGRNSKIRWIISSNHRWPASRCDTRRSPRLSPREKRLSPQCRISASFR